jgi:hypothetical protein
MRLSILAGLLILAVPSAASAQRDDQFVFGFAGGATLTSGLSNDLHEPGPHGMLSWGIGMVDSPWGIRFDGLYSLLGEKTRTIAAPGGPVEASQGKAKLFMLSGNAIFNIYGSNTHLYTLAGLGGYWYNPDGQGTSSKNDLGIQAGLGLYLPGIHAFVEAKWLNLYRALPDPKTGVNGKKSARLYPVTLGILF